ncbi:hypothetical protein ACN47E_002378 [Coniothyrium glycines]
MARSLAAALALAAAPAALAFRNTSPFFLFSTADILLPSAQASMADAATLTQDLLDALKHCPTRSYVIAEQHGVSSADYLEASSAPHLSQYMRGGHDAIRSTYSTPEVLGHLDAAAIHQHIQASCASSDGKGELWIHTFKAPTSDSKHQLQIHDATLEETILDAKSADYTVIYITTPQTESQASARLQDQQHAVYDMESSYPESVQMELRRDLSSTAKRANSTQGGLFERYQYFTPGLFMGFAAIIPLFLILLVGIRALTSLEVSYFAFSKEMGPNAQKKQ